MDLSKYDKPERARRIVSSYSPEFNQFELYCLAKDIIDGCRIADELDVLLDQRITKLAQSRCAMRSSAPVDIDSDGWLSNAKRSLEGD